MTIHSKNEYERRQSRITPEACEQQTRLHARIGAYMLVWSSTESLLIGVLGHLLDTSKANAQIIYAGLPSVHARRTTIAALTKQNVPDPMRSRLLNALSVFKSETTRRNTFAHGQFETNEQGFYTVIHSYDLDDAEMENATVTPTPLTQAWFDDIESGFRHLSWLEDEFGEITDAWLSKQSNARKV